MSKQPTIKSYKLENNETRYMFQLYIGVDPLTVKEQSTTRPGFKTIKEAKDSLTVLKVEINSGTYKKKAVETYKDLYDFKDNEIRINKAVARGKQGLYIGPVKNGEPRTIKMDAPTIQLLKYWKKQQSKEYLQHGFNTIIFGQKFLLNRSSWA